MLDLDTLVVWHHAWPMLCSISSSCSECATAKGVADDQVVMLSHFFFDAVCTATIARCYAICRNASLLTRNKNYVSCVQLRLHSVQGHGFLLSGWLVLFL